ncbi:MULTISPECIES: hypothetical protein [Cupriavidus]
MNKQRIALTAGLAVAAGVLSQSVYAHTQAWYADHLDEAKARDKVCQAKLKADVSLTPDEKSDCDNAVVALVLQPAKRPIAKATSAPAPKGNLSGH